jgi:hypothetical protein
MDVYPVALSSFANGGEEALRITRHELGHIIAWSLFASVTPSQLYIDRASKDPYAVSAYGQNSWAEDFAEGIEAYLRTNAGLLSPNVRLHLMNRFNFFDDIFAGRRPQSAQDQKWTKEHLEIFVQMISDTELLAISPDIGKGILLQLH